jgi:hypothetical protein
MVDDSDSILLCFSIHFSFCLVSGYVLVVPIPILVVAPLAVLRVAPRKVSRGRVGSAPGIRPGPGRPGPGIQPGTASRLLALIWRSGSTASDELNAGEMIVSGVMSSPLW